MLNKSVKCHSVLTARFDIEMYGCESTRLTQESGIFNVFCCTWAEFRALVDGFECARKAAFVGLILMKFFINL